MALIRLMLQLSFCSVEDRRKPFELFLSIQNKLDASLSLSLFGLFWST